MMTHTEAEEEEEAFASVGAAILEYAATLRGRLGNEVTAGAATLPTSTQLVVRVIEGAGLREKVRTSRRTHQRQKAGDPTPRLGDAPMEALVRLILDAAQPGLAVAGLDAVAVGAWLHQELVAAAASWDALGGAVARCVAPDLARVAALRAAAMDLAVRRGAAARRLGMKKCPTWFALEAHPFDAALRLVLEWRRLELRDVRRELELKGTSARTFDSWRRERHVPPPDAPEILTETVLRLSPSRKAPDQERAQVLGVLRGGRAAKIIRRGFSKVFDADVLGDLIAGHQRIAEAVFDALTIEDVGASALLALLLMPKEEWLAHLQSQARFDPQVRAPFEQRWASDLLGEITDDALRSLAAQLDAAPPEERPAMLRGLLMVGAADPETRRGLVTQLAPGSLDEIVMMGPRSRSFPNLLIEIERRLPWPHVVADLSHMARDPRDHVLHAVARNDVLTAMALRTSEAGHGSEKFSGLARSLLRFDLSPAS